MSSPRVPWYQKVPDQIGCMPVFSSAHWSAKPGSSAVVGAGASAASSGVVVGGVRASCVGGWSSNALRGRSGSA